ncbi:putative DNA polymerase [Frankliniella fusca]|uniref:DNA-directed DNA polymerase n=1 Tax=Frankliniella fusca TaxID=407009 RepID=A0AAE1HG46_9NEOP|nr:putative DNA polymerase [Frankliniella fusca]
MDDNNVDVVKQFIDYLQSFGPKTELLITAHNAKAFDTVFLINEIVARKLKAEITLQGAKIICLKVGSWKFIDSLMFLPMPLSAMPKSFSLHELKKGYAPYLAFKPEYFSYNGPMLDREFYCVSTMKSKAADEFNLWYDEQVAKGVVFNFKREITDYCISDVTILRQACLAFRKLFAETAGFDPMFSCTTLSSACMAAYRRNFLPENKIGLVPQGGHHGRGKQSHIALQWLDYESHKLGMIIQTIYSYREISVLGRRVDGYIEIPKDDGTLEKRIYQFHGDYWHQCPRHFPPSETDTENRLDQTRRITALFRRAGHTVIEKWECDFKEDLEKDPEVKAFFRTHPTTRVPPLRLRDALAGGRTNAMKWYHKADIDNGETIKMVDVVSEYPNANLRGKYPYGHPHIYLEGDPNMPAMSTWNGVVKCTVLPPRNLYIPVLPYRAHERLMFPLCRSCVETMQEERCTHDDPAQRELTDTWCAPELLLALNEKGYQLIRVHEVYQYPGVMEYNPETGEDGLLSPYVRCFMALKLQASGWPAECTTPELKQKYVDDVLKYDGVIIDPDKVEKRPALRALSKLLLNSFWGKFGEKTIRPKTEFIYTREQLMNIITDPTKIVSALLPLGEDCVQVTWKLIEDAEETLPTSSLIHAAFTTCFGRLQLYKYLDIVKERALYCDTDSCAYISRPGEPDLPTGSHLGDLTNQIEEDWGPGSFITEMAAIGPKNYAFKTAVGGDTHNVKVCIKVRGITINKSCENLVTFDNLKEMVWGNKERVHVPIPRKITRIAPWRIVNRDTSKIWRAVNTKRRRVDLANTVPHGYICWKGDDEDEEMLEVLDSLYNA